MRCSRCQSDNRDGIKFCERCGAKLELICPHCQADIPADSNFCGKCGQSLGKPPTRTAIDYSQPLSYTPKHLADKILAVRPSVEGERKQVTVLFADVKGFTSISEKLDPEEVQTLISECLAFFTEEIHRYEGTIAQFLGDGVMALFGAPIAHEDAPQRALYAALAIQQRLKDYAEKLGKQGIDFKMRIGLNTGLVVVGRIGDDLTMEYTAMGDTVNLASRMESTAQSGTIQVSENTYRLTEGYFEFEPLGEKELKGKTELVKAYQLLDVGRAKTRLGVAEMRGLTPFVGRQKELGQLMECYERAQKGQGQLVGIVGEPGVGKSRLLLHLRAMLPQGEHAYLEGRCLHYGGSTAFLPFLDVLRAYFDIKEGEREYLIKKKMAAQVSQLDEKLKDILPPLEDILSLKVDDEDYLKLEPALKRVRIFESIRDLLVRESQSRPLVLAVEDLHWIDKSSEEFLGYLIGGLATAHILLLILYRPEYTHQWGSKTYYTQIRVDELSLETSAEMVQAILKEGKAAQDLTKLILDKAAGNPLFMEEFTHSLIEGGYIERKNGQYVLTIKPSEIQVPETVQGIIAARMDRLEGNLKRTMQVASVIGRDFAYRILQTITGMREELKSYLINLQGLEFIYEKSLFPELEYIFKHALTQEVAYNSLLLKRRKEIHDRIGKAIEELYQDRLEEFYEMLAHHYLQAENSEKAYYYLKLSGDKATRNYSNWEAFRFYREAIDVLSKLPDTEDNRRKGIEVRLAMYLPMRCIGYPEDSFQILQEGERLAVELDDQRSLAIIYGMFTVYFLQIGGTLGITYGEKAFDAADKIKDLELMAPTGFDLCVAYLQAGEFLKLANIAPKVITLLEETHRECDSFGRGWNLYSALLAVYGGCMGMLGHLDKGEALLEKALNFALGINDWVSIGLVELQYAGLFITKGEGENTIKHAKNAVKYADEAQVVPFSCAGLMEEGWGYYRLGDYENAAMYLEKSLELQRTGGIYTHLSMVYLGLGHIHLDSGRLKDALACAEESIKWSQNNGEKMNEASARLLRGAVLEKMDPLQYEKAKELILQSIKVLDELQLKPPSCVGLLVLGELYADAGRRKEAVQTLKKAESAFREMGMDYWLRRTKSALEKLQGRK